MHDCGVMHFLDPFDGTEARAVDIHAQALTSELIAVAEMRVVIGDELTSAVVAEVLLLALSVKAVFGDVAGVAVWAWRGVGFHDSARRVHPYPSSILQRL